MSAAMPDLSLLRDPTPAELARLEEHGTRWWERGGYTLKVQDDPRYPDWPQYWLLEADA